MGIFKIYNIKKDDVEKILEKAMTEGGKSLFGDKWKNIRTKIAESVIEFFDYLSFAGVPLDKFKDIEFSCNPTNKRDKNEIRMLGYNNPKFRFKKGDKDMLKRAQYFLHGLVQMGINANDSLVNVGFNIKHRNAHGYTEDISAEDINEFDKILNPQLKRFKDRK